MLKNFFKEIKATIIIIAAISVIIFFSKIEMDLHILMYSLAIYLIILTILYIFSTQYKIKYLDKVIYVIVIPISIIVVIITILIPFWIILIHTIFYFAIAYSIPTLIYKGLTYLNFLDFLTEPTAQYLTITIFVILSVLLNSTLRKIINLISPARVVSSEKMKPYELDKLTDYVLSMNNVRFLIYSGYIVVLLISNYNYFQSINEDINLDYDNVVLQSFATFLAFDTAFIYIKNVDFKPSILQSKINKSILNKITNSDKIKTKDKED